MILMINFKLFLDVISLIVLLLCSCLVGQLIFSFYSDIAQLVEHLTVNQVVDGSSPPVGVVLWRGVRAGRRSIIGNDVNG